MAQSSLVFRGSLVHFPSDASHEPGRIGRLQDKDALDDRPHPDRGGGGRGRRGRRRAGRGRGRPRRRRQGRRGRSGRRPRGGRRRRGRRCGRRRGHRRRRRRDGELAHPHELHDLDGDRVGALPGLGVQPLPQRRLHGRWALRGQALPDRLRDVREDLGRGPAEVLGQQIVRDLRGVRGQEHGVGDVHPAARRERGGRRDVAGGDAEHVGDGPGQGDRDPRVAQELQHVRQRDRDEALQLRDDLDGGRGRRRGGRRRAGRARDGRGRGRGDRGRPRPGPGSRGASRGPGGRGPGRRRQGRRREGRGGHRDRLLVHARLVLCNIMIDHA